MKNTRSGSLNALFKKAAALSDGNGFQAQKKPPIKRPEA